MSSPHEHAGSSTAPGDGPPVEPGVCALCGLPPVAGELVPGPGVLSERRYCCVGCATVDGVLHELPEEERAAARLAIGQKVGLPPEQLAVLAGGAAPDADVLGASSGSTGASPTSAAPGGAPSPAGAPAGASGAPSPASAAAPIVEQRFRISGLQCPSCAWLVEHTLKERAGVLEARVDFLTEIGTVRLDLRETSREGALGALEHIGYRGVRLEDEVGGDPERLVLRFALSAMAGMNCMMLAFVHYAETFGATVGPWRTTIGAFGALLALPAVAYGGGPIFRRALALLRRRRLAMETLLALGIGASTLLSLLAFVLPGADFYFEIPTMIVTTALGARLVDRAIRRVGARRVAALLEPRPVKVRRVDRDSGAVVGFAGVNDLEAGELVMVPAGEEVPADVEVVGESVSVSEAMLTGEARPVLKRTGATVLAGSEVVEGTLRGEVLRPPERSAHAQISEQILDVVQGQSERTAAADRIAAWFVLAVLLVATATTIAHAVVLGHGLTHPASWLPAIAVLVVACPCAFSIAASASMGTAAIRLLGDGVLLRDPDAFARAGATRAVVFDKTGTLTTGDMDVHAVHWRSGDQDLTALADLAGLERRSRHPMAAAIRRFLRGQDLTPTRFDEVEEVRGVGVRGRSADGREVAAGAPALFEAEDLPGEPSDDGEARPTVYFGPREAPVGWLELEDPIRTEAEAAVRALSASGQEVHIVSGDAPKVVERCARALGVQSWAGRVLPGDKAERVEALRRDVGGVVMYVGDGINDGPALRAADVGIAMRQGASIALESADLLSLRDDPGAAAHVIALSRRLARITRQNYVWAVGYNLVLVPVAAMGWLHPTYSAVAMLFSSVGVLANSARLLR